MKKLSQVCLITCLLQGAHAQTPSQGIPSISQYQARYGESQKGLDVDANKELPRYPSQEPKAALKSWKVKKGFKLEFAAHEPQVRDPIAVCFDERGRMFVCEMIDYSEQRDLTPHLGRVSMLEDKDGDGYYETSTVYADNLAWPTGLIWANGQLFVIATPHIWSLKDADGDGIAEQRKIAFTGFGTGLEILNVQGLANSPQWGHDNRIHILSGGGNRGKVSSPLRPDLPAQELSGQDFWFDPLTMEFGLEPGGAQYGMSFDDFGRKFACSNSDHLQYWIHDGRYTTRNPYYRLPNPRQSIAVDGGAAEVFRISPDEPWRILRTRWRISGMVKGVVEGGGRVSGYFTGASGTTVYRGDALGPDMLNNSFTGDAGGQLAHRKKITYAADGINLSGRRPADETKFEFAASSDTWVRVVNFANAPDGCFYICDMYREVIEHPWSIPEPIKQHLDLTQGNTRGRLYRIVPDRADFKARTQVNLAESTSAALVGFLKHKNGWHRDTAHRLLVERNDATTAAALRSLLSEARNSVATQLHALSVLKALKALDDTTLVLALTSKQPLLIERAVELAPASLLLKDEVWPQLAIHERVNFTATLKVGDIDASHPAAKAKVLSKLLDALRSDKEWLHAAVYSAPPAFTADLIEHALTAKIPAPRLSTLLTTLGAHHSETELQRIVPLIVKEPLANQAILVAALAQGLQQAKSSLGKADPQGQFQAAFASAQSTALDASADPNARVAAITLLGLSRTTTDTLFECLQAQQPQEIALAAARTLAQQNAANWVTRILSEYSQYSPLTQQSVLELLANRPAWVKSLLQAINSPKGPQAKDLNASLVQALLHHKDKNVVSLAQTQLASVIPPSRQSVIEKFTPATQLAGDPVRGKLQFQMRCMACHVAEGQGVLVGPDMVTVKSRGRDGLLEAILDPHKEIAPQYVAYQFQAKDGRAFQGIITADDAQAVTLKMMGGLQQTLSRSEIQSSSSSGQSLMPEGLETGMSEQDMADLLSYLEAL